MANRKVEFDTGLVKLSRNQTLWTECVARQNAMQPCGRAVRRCQLYVYWYLLGVLVFWCLRVLVPWCLGVSVSQCLGLAWFKLGLCGFRFESGLLQVRQPGRGRVPLCSACSAAAPISCHFCGRDCSADDLESVSNVLGQMTDGSILLTIVSQTGWVQLWFRRAFASVTALLHVLDTAVVKSSAKQILVRKDAHCTVMATPVAAWEAAVRQKE